MYLSHGFCILLQWMHGGRQKDSQKDNDQRKQRKEKEPGGDEIERRQGTDLFKLCLVLFLNVHHWCHLRKWLDAM